MGRTRRTAAAQQWAAWRAGTRTGQPVGDRVAAWLTRRLSSMGAVYATVLLSAAWMVVGSRELLGLDPYPYPVLLFVGNLVQLLLIFVIMVGQRTLSAAGDERSRRTHADTVAILAECHRLQEHIDDRARLLNRGTSTPRDRLDPCDTSPIMAMSFAAPEPAPTSRNRRLAAWLVERLGRPSAVVGTTVVVVVWMVLATAGLIDDPYPFPFLLFCSSLAQLVLMFLIMVGQDVLGEGSDRRSVETAEHTAVVLQQCRHLRHHLAAQDALLERLVVPSGGPTPGVPDDDRPRPAGSVDLGAVPRPRTEDVPAAGAPR